MTLFCLLATSCASSLSSAPLPLSTATPSPSGQWTTYHHDNAHSGYDPSAPTLSSVHPTNSWQALALDNQIFASPLVYQGLLYTATLNNTLYALNQADGTVVWSRHLGDPVMSGWSCGNATPQGILSTPVLDLPHHRLYAVALLASTHTYQVFGLDLVTGEVVFQQALNPSALGANFNWTIQQQRGALALANGYLYVPFGGRLGDCGDYHGYIVAVSLSTPASLHVYHTPGSGSGYWSAGGITIDDTTGDLFVASGNANVGDGCQANSTGGPEFENDAVIRLSPTLDRLDFFMPADWQSSWCSNDQDLGSATPLLLNSHLLFTAGKHGAGFLLDPSHLGGINGQLFPAPSSYSQADICLSNHSGATFGSFAYAPSFIYLECDGHGLVALHTDLATASFTPCPAACPAPSWRAGGDLTFGPPIVAAGAVWVASDNNGLYAFNALNGLPLYHSAPFALNRFVTPASAGHQIFVPSGNSVLSFTFA